jgi:hypothetical protein
MSNNIIIKCVKKTLRTNKYKSYLYVLLKNKYRRNYLVNQMLFNNFTINIDKILTRFLENFCDF